MADLFSQLSLPAGIEEGFDFPLEGSDADADMQFLELWPELLHEQVRLNICLSVVKCNPPPPFPHRLTPLFLWHRKVALPRHVPRLNGCGC